MKIKKLIPIESGLIENLKLEIGNCRRGYIALSSIIIIMAVVLSISVTVTYLAIGEAQSSLALTQGEGTLDFVEGCLEDALIKVRANGNYSGGTITRPEGTCSITVSGPPSSTWTITATTADTSYVRKVQAVTTVNGYGITLSSWKEI